MDVSVFAPAKVNLSLNITGRRADGYHDLHSLVVPCVDLGDDLIVSARENGKPGFTMEVDGAFRDVVPTRMNSLEKAYALYAEATGFQHGIHVHLHKNIPANAGLGGGSADAAALLRALHLLHTGETEPDEALFAIAARLGADMPVCLLARPCIMEGIGEILTPLNDWQDDLHAVLIWPGPGPSTKELYEFLDLEHLPSYSDDQNHFEATAITLTPRIGDALNALRAMPDCKAARLTGSGTSVFGLFDESPASVPQGFPWAARCLLGEIKKPLVTIVR